MGKQGPPSIVIVAALAVAKAALARVRNHFDHGQQERAPNAALARQLTHEEMSPLQEAVSRIGSLRLSHGVALELPDDALPPSPCCDGPEDAAGAANASRLAQWLRALALPTALTTASTSTTATAPAESKQALHGVRLLQALSPAQLGKLAVEMLAVAMAGAAQQWLVLALVALLVVVEVAQVIASARLTLKQQQQQQQQQQTQVKQRAAEEEEEVDASMHAPVVSSAVKAVPAAPAAANPLLTGVWHKVDSRSDSQDEAANILKLGGVARTAMKMFKGMEFDVSSTHLTSTAITKVPFVKVAKETYALDGAVSVYPRRDMRKGNFVGYCKVTPDGGLNLYYKFEELLAGHSCDEIRLIAPNELHITTQLTVGDQSCAYRVVYYRAGSARSARNSSAGARNSVSGASNPTFATATASNATPSSSASPALASVGSGGTSDQLAGVAGVGSVGGVEAEAKSTGSRSRSHSSSGSVASSQPHSHGSNPASSAANTASKTKAGSTKAGPTKGSRAPAPAPVAPATPVASPAPTPAAAPASPVTAAAAAAQPLCATVPLPAPLLQLLCKAQAAAQAAVKEASHNHSPGQGLGLGLGHGLGQQGQGQCPRSVLAPQPSVSSDEATGSGRDSEEVGRQQGRGGSGGRWPVGSPSPARMPPHAHQQRHHDSAGWAQECGSCSSNNCTGCSKGDSGTCNTCNSPLGSELGMRNGRSRCASPVRGSLDVSRRHAHRREDDLGRFSLEADVIRNRDHAGCPFVHIEGTDSHSNCSSRPRFSHPPSPTPCTGRMGGAVPLTGMRGLPPMPRGSMDDGRRSPLNPGAHAAHAKAGAPGPPRPCVSPFARVSQGAT